jgi:hypothetical protein
MMVPLKIGVVTFAILLILSCSIGDSKEYLKGAITADEKDNQEVITIHFNDFPYDVSTKLSKKFKEAYPSRFAYQKYNRSDENIDIGDHDSMFVGEIDEQPDYIIERKDYINRLVEFCSGHWFMQGRVPSALNILARENTTTGLTFYPKIIDSKTCTVLEYTGIAKNFYDGPTNVVGLFIPLNETKEGCDRYLMLCSGNQTADWLDSVSFSERT